MKQIIDTTKQTRTLYVYRNVVSFEQDKIDDYIFTEYGKYSDDVEYIESKVASQWENGEVEEVQVDLAGFLHYVNECYHVLECVQ